MLGSNIGADALGEDVIDIDPTSDKAEPSDTTRPTTQERANDPLPNPFPPQSTHPTVSLNGTTEADSPNRIYMGEDSVHADINNKELSMALGGQFAPQKPLS